MRALRAVIALAGLGAVVGLAIGSGRAQPPGDAPTAPAPLAPVDVATADFPALVEALIDEFQGVGGGDPKAANGWTILLDAAAKMEDVHKRVWRKDADRARGEPSDFTIIYDPAEYRDKPANERQATEAVTRAVMKEAEAAGIPALLADMAAAPRMARARLGSVEDRARLAALGVTDPDDQGRLIMTLLPELGLARQLARYQAARLHEAGAAGRWEEASATLESMLAIARALAHDFTMISRYAGMGVSQLAYRRAIEAVMTQRPGAPALEALGAAVQRQTAARPPLELVLRGERLVALDACRWAWSDPARPMDIKAARELEVMTGGGAPAGKGGPGNAAQGGTRAANVQSVEELWTVLRAWASADAGQRALLTDPQVWCKERAGPDAMVACLMAPGVDKALRTERFDDLLRSGLLAMIAVERYQRRTNAYPATWEQVIAAGLLEAAPTDPVSGQGLMYKRLASPDGQGRAYLVYSVGRDGKDNGGAQEEGRGRLQAVVSPTLGEGFDYVVNQRD